MKSLGALVEFLQLHRRGRAPAQILRHQFQVVGAGLGPLAVRTDIVRIDFQLISQSSDRHRRR
jgi:hypothetical protein